MKILIYGASGMLGSTLFRYFSQVKSLQVWGSFRKSYRDDFPNIDAKQMLEHVEVEDGESLLYAMQHAKPDVIINCIGIIKQLAASKDPIPAITINALLPHQLAKLSKTFHARFIHISTDCVFSGSEGFYTEQHIPDAKDVYGRSKLLGEVVDEAHALTLRTSMIGHELHSNLSLVDWFLSQKNEVQGFKHAIFSGFPTIELAKIIHMIITECPDLSGLYHVAAQPINKFDLLKLVAQVYGKDIHIHENTQFVLDRSLDGTRFNQATGYQAPAWPALIQDMYEFQKAQSAHALEAV